MSERLARIAGDLWSSGVFPDLKQQSAPLWVDATNVIFSNGAVGVFPGSLPLFLREKVGVITGLGELSALALEDADGVLFGFRDSLHVWDEVNGVRNLGTGYTGIASQTRTQRATRWSFQQWNEWIAATNGVDHIQLCKDLSTGFEDMNTGTQFSRAEVIRKYRQFLIAFNLDDQHNAIAWCDVNDPDTWEPDATNVARKIYLQDLEDIIAVEPFGEAHFMYGKDKAYALTFTGFPNVFEPQPLQFGAGVYGKNCVTLVKGMHVGIGPRGIWAYDGNTPQYFDQPALKKWLEANLNKDQASKCVVYNDKTLHHVLFFFPKTGDLENSIGLAWNYDEPSKWAPLSFSRTAASDEGKLLYGITSDTVGNVYRQSLQDISVGVGEGAGVKCEGTGEVLIGFGQGGFGDFGFGGVFNV